MKRIVLGACLVLLGCTHAKDAEKKEPPPTEAPKQEEAPRAPDRTKPREQQPPRKHPDAPPDSRPPAEEGRPELSMSPQGLMTEDGPRLIQDALVKRGYLELDKKSGELDEATTAALRKFQDAQGLARTGAPDRETVRKLGLSISSVFRKASDRDQD